MRHPSVPPVFVAAQSTSVAMARTADSMLRRYVPTTMAARWSTALCMRGRICQCAGQDLRTNTAAMESEITVTGTRPSSPSQGVMIRVINTVTNSAQTARAKPCTQ